MTKAMTKCGFFVKTIFVFSFCLFLTACGSNDGVFQGYVEGDYSYIASAVSGNLTEKLVSRGDNIKENQPLFVLDPQPETARLKQAQSELGQAKQKLLDIQKGARFTIIASIEAQLRQGRASLDFAQKTYERYKKLYQQRVIDKSSFDQASSQYQQQLQAVKAIEAKLAEAKLGARENLIAAQKAVVVAAEAAVQQARWAVLQKSVRSPVAAQVFDTLYEPGEFVNAGQPVVVLLPPNKIKLIFFIPENRINQIKIGDEVIVDCDSCNNSYKAKINFVSPNAEFTPPVIFSQDSRGKLVYRVEAKTSVAAAKNFHPGQPVDVIIEKEVGNN